MGSACAWLSGFMLLLLRCFLQFGSPCIDAAGDTKHAAPRTGLQVLCSLCLNCWRQVGCSIASQLYLHIGKYRKDTRRKMKMWASNARFNFIPQVIAATRAHYGLRLSSSVHAPPFVQMFQQRIITCKWFVFRIPFDTLDAVVDQDSLGFCNQPHLK